MKLFLSLTLFILSFGLLSHAQSPIIAVPSSGGILGWITDHGGYQAAILLLVGSAMAVLSAIRTVLSNFDGVAPGAAIPSNLQGLTLVNKICVILGQIIDFLQGNVQH